MAELKAMIAGNTTTTNSAAVSSTQLEQNTPNPATKSTTIRYFIPVGVQKADLLITDYSGKMIKTIPISTIGSGSITIEAALLSSGAYNYSIVVEGRTIVYRPLINWRFFKGS